MDNNNNNLVKKNYINNLLNTYFNLFVVIFMSFALFLSYFLLLKPKVDETTNAISENISSHEKILQAEKTKLANLQAAVLAYKSISPVDIARVNSILPDEYDKEALYGEIEEIIKQNGFIPTSITLSKEGEAAGVAVPVAADAKTTKVGAAKISDKIGVVDVSISIASIDYAGMKNLLSVLESNIRIFDIQQLSLVDGGAATLKFSTYYYKK